MDKIPKAQETEAKLDRRNYITLKSFCPVRKQSNEETTYRIGKYIYKLYICPEVLARIYKEVPPKKLVTKIKNSTIQIGE